MFMGTSFFCQKRLQAEAMVTNFSIGSNSELLKKFLTADFEEFDVRLIVGLHIPAHDKMVVGINFLLVPLFKLGLLFGGHTIWIVHIMG